MEKIKLKKRTMEDMDDSYVPARTRTFKLKERTAPQSVNAEANKEPETRAPKADTDESGLDKAYADSSNLHLDSEGTLYVAGTKGNFWGSEWLENYKTMGVPLLANALGIHSPYEIEENNRYTQLDNFMKMHPGQVKNLVGHSKGAAVIHTWMKNNPDFKGQSRLYATPYEDFLGKEKAKTTLDQLNAFRNASYEHDAYKDPIEKYLVDTAVNKFSNFFGLDEVKPVKGETRIANEGDPAALLDGSAERYPHPNPFKYISGGGPHDYHEGIARFTSGFGVKNTMPDRPGTDFDTNYTTLDTATKT